MAAYLLLWCAAGVLAPVALTQSVQPPSAPDGGCRGPTGSGVLCYISTECRGGVVIPAVPSVAECCGGASGLSYCDEAGCEDCFSEEAYTSSGTEFYLGFFNNLRFQSRLSLANLRVQITSDDSNPAQVSITYTGNVTQVTVDPGDTVNIPIDLPSGGIGIGDRDRAVVVQSTNGRRITVAGLGEEVTSSDSFCILPNLFFPTSYKYYAVSVPQTQVPFTSDGVQEDIVPDEKSAFLIVTSEDSTQLSITLTQSVSTDGAEDLQQFGPMINRGETISLTLNSEETLYIASVDDLTGSRVVANKPITFLSGHECGTIPQTMNYCDQLVEEIPPTATWGFEFLTAPFRTREGGYEFLTLASENGTTVSVFCTLTEGEGSIRQFQLNAGESLNYTASSSEYCRVVSTGPILLIQFSLASGTDNNENADPFMVLLPSIQQYKPSLSFRVFETLASFNESHYINIFLPGGFDTSGVRLNNQPIPSVVWEDVYCRGSPSSGICGFVSLLEITSDTQSVTHVDQNAQMAVIVYSLAFRTGRGFSAGMSLLPIALDRVSLSDDTYSVLESEEQVVLNITRIGRAVGSLSLLLRSRALSTGSAAIVEDDFLEVRQTVTFAPGQTVAMVIVPLATDDVFPEPDKIFELFLSSVEGVFVSPFAAATVTILNDDPDLPVMEVGFGRTQSFVAEGNGFFQVNLVKSSGAVGPVQVRLSSISDTAMEELDFLPINVVITFDVNEIQKTEQIRIIDDRILEDIESFQLILEPINNLDEGAFPVIVIDDTFDVFISDNDVAVIGYISRPCLIEEGVGIMTVQVGLLSGNLGRNVSVAVRTIGGSAVSGIDFSPLSQFITITPSSPLSTLFVPIINDSIVEETEFFTLILSLTGVDIEIGNVVLVDSTAEVFIEDDDDAVLALSVIPGRVVEGGVAMVTLLAQEGQLPGRVEVRVSTIDGNATGGVDFEPLSGVPLLSGGSLSISTFDNSQFEGDKVFSVVAELVTEGRVRISPLVTTVTIDDDEQPPQVQCYLSRGSCLDRDQETVRLSSMRDCCLLLGAESFSFPNDPSGLCQDCIVIGFNRSEFRLVERNMSYSLTVDVRTGFLPQSISLGLETVPGSASLADYSVPSTITLLADPTNPELTPSAQLSVTLPQEEVNNDEEFESFRINILDSFGIAPSNMFFRGTVVTITDFEPMVGFLRTLYVVEEGVNRTAVLDVVVLPPATQPLTFTITFRSGTAQIGSDARLLDDDALTFTIPAGVSIISLPFIRIEADDVYENDESFFAEISDISTGALGSSSTEIEIIDSTDILMGFTTTSLYRVMEGEGAVEVTVGVIEGSLGREVEILLTTADLTAIGGVDYVPVSQVLTFDPQNQELSINITVLDDVIVEESEDFSVRLSSNLPRVTLFPSVGSVTITDNDVPPPPQSVVEFARVSYTVAENEEEENIVLDLSIEPPSDVIIILTLRISSDTATIGSDVSMFQQLTTFLIDENTTSILGPRVLDDLVFEDDEVIFFEIVNITNGVLGENLLANVTILDDDEIQMGFLRSERFDGSVYDVVEEEGTVEIAVGVSEGILGRELEIMITSSGQDFGAQDGVDYVSISQVLTFDAQNPEQNVNLTLIDDEIDEGGEFFTIRLSLVNRLPRVVLFPGLIGVNIIDNDRRPVTLRFGQSSYTVTEGDGRVDMLVFIGNSGFNEVLVQIEVISGTAGTDDIINPATQYFAEPGSEGVRVIIPIRDDSLVEETESFLVRIIPGEFQIVDPESSLATVIILDNDATDVRFQQDVYTAFEGSTESLLLTASVVGNQIGFDLPISIQPVSGGSATGGLDYQAFSIEGVLNVTQPSISFSITIIDDEEQEENEFLLVNIVSRSNANITFGSARVVIIDNEIRLPQVGFQNRQLVVNEFSEVEGELVLVSSGPSLTNLPITVIVEYTSGTANVEEDLFVSPPTNITINPETLTGTIRIFPAIDERFEQLEENFTVRIVSASGAVVGAGQDVATVTIIDSDLLFVRVGVVDEFGATRENETLMLTLDNGLFSDLNITFFVSTTTNISVSDFPLATEGDDFTPLNQFPVVLPANNFGLTTVPLDILVNDNITESISEVMGLTVSTDNERVIIQAGASLQVLISDNDNLVVGFSQSTYTTPENSTLFVTVEIVNGILDEGLGSIMRVLTRDIDDEVGAAIAFEDYEPVDRIIQFTQMTTSIQIPIAISLGEEEGDYVITEIGKRFEVTLVDLSRNILLNFNPNVATVTIVNLFNDGI